MKKKLFALVGWVVLLPASVTHAEIYLGAKGGVASSGLVGGEWTAFVDEQDNFANQYGESAGGHAVLGFSVSPFFGVTLASFFAVQFEVGLSRVGGGYEGQIHEYEKHEYYNAYVLRVPVLAKFSGRLGASYFLFLTLGPEFQYYLSASRDYLNEWRTAPKQNTTYQVDNLGSLMMALDLGIGIDVPFKSFFFDIELRASFPFASPYSSWTDTAPRQFALDLTVGLGVILL